MKKPNPAGIFDMHGNVWEWCSDWYDEKLSGGTDPVGHGRGSFRVARGGGWRNLPGPLPVGEPQPQRPVVPQ